MNRTPRLPTVLSASPKRSPSRTGKWFASLASVSILASTIPANAVSVTVVEDSATRLSFDVVWGENLVLPIGASTSGQNFQGLDANDFFSSVSILVTPSSPPSYIPIPDGFVVIFSQGLRSDRSFELADLASFSGVQALPLANEPFGARFVYGAVYPPTPPSGVPDGGSPMLMLGAGVLVAGLARRVMVTR